MRVADLPKRRVLVLEMWGRQVLFRRVFVVPELPVWVDLGKKSEFVLAVSSRKVRDVQGGVPCMPSRPVLECGVGNMPVLPGGVLLGETGGELPGLRIGKILK